jgi:hypothetical protein
MDEFGLTLIPSSSIDFRNFLSFHFLSFKPNKALMLGFSDSSKKKDRTITPTIHYILVGHFYVKTTLKNIE